MRRRMDRDDVDIHLFSGGTQTNRTALSAFLRPHEAAVAARTGHILVHETGAIEATGHKVIAIDTDDGKIRPDQLQVVLDLHTDEHMVKPRLGSYSPQKPVLAAALTSRRGVRPASRGLRLDSCA